MGAHRIPLKQRFEEKVMPIPWGGCWEWLGHLAGTGYAAIRDDAANGSRQLRASHVSYELHIGPVEEGKIVCHTCDNPRCVNPYHLFLGTHLDNARDRDAKGRQARQRGEDQGQAKLKWADVDAIRLDSRSGAELATAYGVSEATISNILNGRRWIVFGYSRTHKRGNTKLDIKEVEKIRVDGRSTRATAKAFGVSQALVWKIRNSKVRA